MGELRSALDALAALAADDVRGLAPRQQLDEITVLLEARNRLDAQLARRVRAAELQQAPEDDGLKSMRSWLRGHGRLSPAAAGQLVRNGRALDHLPALACAFADGAVTAEQVAVVAPVVTADRYGTKELAEHAAMLVDPESVDNIADGIRRVLDDRALVARLVSAGRERSDAFRWSRCAAETLQVLEAVGR